MRVKLTLEYDGTNYSGWQYQVSEDSIQARIESCLQRIFGEAIRLYGAGRTDAGVHALGQVAGFKLPRPFPLSDLMRALNALLPRDIVVKEIAGMPDDFDPRRDARARIYEYRILTQPVSSAFEHRYSWHVSDPLDLGSMEKAAECFVGDHDFAAFRTLGTELKSTVRNVAVSSWKADSDHLLYRVQANGFLRHMVRTMVAAMVQAGRGSLGVGDIISLLSGGRRSDAPAPAPACGLFLVEVRY